MLMWLKKTAFILFMLLIPAFLFLFSVSRHGDLNAAYVSKWFWGNYLMMAAPHLIVVIFGWGGGARWRTLAITFAVLNIALITFQCCIWFVVPAGESGLAWIYYYPLSGATLVAIMLYFGFKERAKRLP